MTQDPRLPELFAQAAELAGEARAAWLDELRGAEPELAREVEDLLRAATAGERRFAAPAWERPTAVDAGEEAGATALPDRVGPYRIVREIGRGGMGRVFLAEQEGAEFRRNVALKVLDRPAAGEQSVRRFRDEARILAGLEHPGIARFYDAGRAEDGTWYLALEYVEGEDLLSFVRRRELDLRSRVELVLEVLDAVDFAHRRLVVHRDIKPANVLVGADGHVKLLDFGISKIVDPEASGEAAETRTALRAFTPAYASPEQFRGERATVATDVYSLGIVLYEMLTGRRPFDRKPGSGLDADRAAQERDPAPPSTAARRAATQSADVSDTTSTTVTVPWRALAGDLDAITLKALRAEPEARYRSAAAFADDLQHWLRGEPVEARRGGRRYRLAKFVGRHRVTVTLAAALIVALAAGVAGTLVQSRRVAQQAAIAQRQRDFALRELSRAEAINELNAFLVFDAAPGGRPFTASDLLARAEQLVQRQRGRADEHRAELLVAIGRHYHGFEENTKALALLEQAYELAQRSGEPAVLAKAACALAGSRSDAEEIERAEALVAQGLGLLGEEPQLALHRVFCLLRRAEVARDAGQGEKAVESVLAAQRLLRSSGQGSSLVELRVALDLAESQRAAGNNREADLAFESAAVLLESLGYGDTETAGTLFNNHALVLRALGQPLAAEHLFRRAIEIGSAGRGDEGVSPVLLGNLARTLVDLERTAEARDYAERSLARARASGTDFALTLALFHLTYINTKMGDLPAAARAFAELEPRVAAEPSDHYYHASFASHQAMFAERRGDLIAARTRYDRSIELADEQDLPVLLQRRAAFEVAAGDYETARADAVRALALAQKAAEAGVPSSRVGLAHLALARALRGLGRTEESRAAAGAALAQLEPSVGSDHPDTRAARELAAPAPGAVTSGAAADSPVAAAATPSPP